ncbi:MAG TPA: ice-binding family protein [Acidimicrobiia bacterium]|nr:ice-binding family protein [Acidimicrobiia bacterium]
MKLFRTTLPARIALLVVLVLAASHFIGGGTASAAPTPVGLGTATDFAIRAGDGISNTPTSAITGDVGLSPGPGTAYTGLTCAEVTGTVYKVDATGLPCAVEDPGLMTTVSADARTAFNTTSALPGATPLATDLAGENLVAGLYSFGAAATNLSGPLTLNAAGDPSSVWIFQASSSLITSPGSTISFSNLPPGTTAAQLACNVYWTVGSSATLDTTTNFIGTILASASITVNNGATVTGRLLAANQPSGAGAVTLIADTIVRPTGCTTSPAGTGGTPAAPASPTDTPTTPGTPTGPGSPGTPGGPPADATPPATPATPVGSPPTFTG